MVRQFNIEEAARQYQSAQPFPHIVLHDIIDEELLNKVVEEFPDIANSPNQNHVKNYLESKNYTSGRALFGKATNKLVDYFNSPEWVNILQKITGIQEPLISDEELVGGGLSESGRGGILKLHSDFNNHIKHGWDRRINMLVYLNKDWDEAWGGDIQLWNRELTECVSRAYPHFGTVVIFNTDDYSYHGFPDKITCPEDRRRMSLNIYYYSNGRPEHEKNPIAHYSLWQTRKGVEADKDVAAKAEKE